MPHKMNSRSAERINGLLVLLRGYAGMAGELAGAQWNEGDVSDSVVRRVALPDAFFALDGLFETALTVLDEFGAYPAVIARELDRYLPFLATTAVLMAAVRAGVGRETAHEVIKEHAVGVALAMREKGQADNDLVARLQGDERLGLAPGALDGLLADPLRSPARRRRRSRRSSPGSSRSPPHIPRPPPTPPGRSCEAPALGQGPRRVPRRLDDGDDLVLVASDRISIYDVVLPTADPGQGRGAHPAVAVVVRPARRPRAEPRDLGDGRPAGVRRAGDALPAAGDAAGGVRRPRLPHRLRAQGLREDGHRVRAWRCRPGSSTGRELPEPIFTPSTKAPLGQHDEAITFADVEDLVGAETAATLRDLTLAVYARGAETAAANGHPRRRHEARVRPRPGDRRDRAGRRGADPRLVAVLARRPLGAGPAAGLVRQAVRARLVGDAALGPHRRPAPEVPADVVAATRARYVEAYERLTGLHWA